MSTIVYNTEKFPLPDRDTILQNIVDLTKDIAAEVYIFGSVARGSANPGSDIDLILVCNTKTPFVERPLEFKKLYDHFPRLDLLVYTPEEFKKLINSDGSAFWDSIKKDIRQISH